MSKQIHLSLFSQPVVSLITSKTVFKLNIKLKMFRDRIPNFKFLFCSLLHCLVKLALRRLVPY